MNIELKIALIRRFGSQIRAVKGITEGDVLRTFPGAKVKKSVERQFLALVTKNG